MVYEFLFVADCYAFPFLPFVLVFHRIPDTMKNRFPKLPTIRELSELVRSVKREISPEFRAFDDDDKPGIQLTVGWCHESGNWSFQTGDNSYTGGAYSYPHWGVVGVYRSSDSVELARDIQNQLADGAYSAMEYDAH